MLYLCIYVYIQTFVCTLMCVQVFDLYFGRLTFKSFNNWPTTTRASCVLSSFAEPGRSQSAKEELIFPCCKIATKTILSSPKKTKQENRTFLAIKSHLVLLTVRNFERSKSWSNTNNFYECQALGKFRCNQLFEPTHINIWKIFSLRRSFFYYL